MPEPWQSLAFKNVHPRDKHVRFVESTHTYYIDGSSKGIVSTTGFVHAFFGHFDPKAGIACMKRDPEKWAKNPLYGKTDKEIIEIWSKSGQEASGKGTALHLAIEQHLNGAVDRIPPDVMETPEWRYYMNFYNDNKDSLEPYRTEWEVWDNEHRLSGSIDMIFKRKDGDFAVYDWKRSKQIKIDNKYQSGEGPMSHLPDCNYWHYTLQLNVLSTPPVTSVSANGPLTFCLGDSVVLTALGGSSYSWSTGDTAQSITVKSGGNYSVTAVGQGNQCGNANTVSTTINVVPVINTPTIIPPNPFGTTMSGSTTLVLTSSSNVNYSYQWGARGGVVDSSGNGYAYIDWGAPDTNAAVWVIISNGYCTDSVGIDIVIISGVGLDDNSLNSIILSPNPNSGLFSINVDQEHIGSSYQILDNLGRLIDKGIIRELSQDFNLSDKPKGIYRIQVSNDKALKTLNVVIQ